MKTNLESSETIYWNSLISQQIHLVKKAVKTFKIIKRNINAWVKDSADCSTTSFVVNQWNFLVLSPTKDFL